MGKRIKAIRKMLGKSQEEFGQLFDPPAPKSSVSYWENGGGPNKKRLKKIADLGGVTPAYLINGSQLSIDDLRELTEKVESQDPLTNEEINKANEALLDTKFFSKTLFDSTNQKAKAKLKEQQQIINKHPLNPFDLELYADFIALFNLLRLKESEQQYVGFSTLISFMLRIANGTMKYDRDDLLPNIDEWLSALPVKDNKEKK